MTHAHSKLSWLTITRVTTDAGGIPDVVTDGVNGLIVKMDDHEALARAAMHLIEHPFVTAK